MSRPGLSQSQGLRNKELKLNGGITILCDIRLFLRDVIVYTSLMIEHVLCTKFCEIEGILMGGVVCTKKTRLI